MSGGPIGILANPAFMDAMADPRAAQQYQPRGILGQFDQFAQNNSAALLGLGAGLLSGDGFGAAAQGYAQGMQQDQRTRLIKQKEADDALKKQKALELTEKYKLPNAFAADPDAVFSMVQNIEMRNRAQSAPLEIERQLTAAGITDPAERQAIIRRQVVGDPKLQEFDPDKTYGVRDPSAPGGYRIVQPGGIGTTPQSGDVAIPPAPPGVNPKIWRDEKTKELAQQGKPTTEMTNKLAAAEKSAADLNNALDNYNALVQRYGAEAWNGPAKSQMQTAYSDLIIKMKEAANLGVLNGPDLPLMQKQIEEAAVTGIDRVNPFSGVNALGIEGRVNAQIGQIKKSVGQGVDNARRVYGGKQPSASQAIKGTTRSGVSWSAN